MKKTNLKIGELDLDSPFLLAPLAGITDRAMRSLCYQAGASLTYTEMVSAKGLWYGDRKTSELLVIGEDEGPVAYQLFGSEPAVLAYAVSVLSEASPAVEYEKENIPGPPPKPWKGYVNDRRPVLFDLNAGCPVPKIVKNGEGSALLKNPDLLHDCVEAMCRAAKKAAGEAGITRPVTVKIRKGFRRDEDLSLENAKAIEAAGASAITVHGRCREQYYEGRADWECIGRVKKSVGIPVIGNGDVMGGDDAVRMMEETGCDGVMIARGALGNPWIFDEAKRLFEQTGCRSAYTTEGSMMKAQGPSKEERIDMLIKHIDLVCSQKGEYTGVREMRKHVGWYIKGMPGAAHMRARINDIEGSYELKQAIKELVR